MRYLDNGLHVSITEICIVMETELESLEQATPIPGQCANLPCKSDWNIAIFIEVNADARRICQALTVPEYLEAWFCIPDQPATSQIVASPEPNGYRLDLYAAGRVAVSFSGSYMIRRRRKMLMFWRTTRRPTCSESLVDFRLRGNFGSSILELRQTALASYDEYLWHQRLWHRSLQTLASILRSA
jgi:hypothetical protein